MRVQTLPNYAGNGRVCLTRIRWETGAYGLGGYSSKFSVSLVLRWREWFVGVRHERRNDEWLWWVGIGLPILVRFKLIRSYGGTFP